MREAFHFAINGFCVYAEYEDTFTSQIVKPLLRKLAKLQKKAGRRIIVFLAAPPATGKSTLAAYFAHLSQNDPSLPALQAIGMDGFHYTQQYILSHTLSIDGVETLMKAVKGCPETFDLALLKTKLLELQTKPQVYWPPYNRKKHDVEPDALLVDQPIVVLEGNYLLLRVLHWQELASFCDFSIFIEAKEAELQSRLLLRKMKGGCAPHEAMRFYETSEKRNIKRIMEHQMPCDIKLQLTHDGDYQLIYPDQIKE